jgi:hypothetical protein
MRFYRVQERVADAGLRADWREIRCHRAKREISIPASVKRPVESPGH